MKNTAFLTSEEEELYEAYSVLGVVAVKEILQCSRDAAHKEIRRILKLVSDHKKFEERQAVRYGKIQTAINQAKFDDTFNYTIMSEL